MGSAGMVCGVGLVGLCMGLSPVDSHERDGEDPRTAADDREDEREKVCGRHAGVSASAHERLGGVGLGFVSGLWRVGLGVVCTRHPWQVGLGQSWQDGPWKARPSPPCPHIFRRCGDVRRRNGYGNGWDSESVGEASPSACG